jgi:hypothetical protein
LENFILPGCIEKKKSGAVEDDLKRLYTKTGITNVLPDYANHSFTMNGETRHISGKEYTTYVKTEGQIAYRVLQNLMDGKAFLNLSDTEKADVITNAYKYASYYSKRKSNKWRLQTVKLLFYCYQSGRNATKGYCCRCLFTLPFPFIFSQKSEGNRKSS